MILERQTRAQPQNLKNQPPSFAVDIRALRVGLQETGVR